MLRNLLDDVEAFYLVTFSGLVEEWRFRLFGIL